MNDYKFRIPELPDTLKEPQSEREKEYLNHIESLREMLRKDFATGLEHREEYLSSTEGKKGVFIYIDGDNLKKINDIAESHDVGDAAIKAFARAISQSMEESIKSVLRGAEKGNVARMGGDEFAVFIPNATLDVGKMVAERILEAIRREVISHPKLGEHKLTASLGVGESRELADQAMYLAKHKGRNRVEVIQSEPKTALSTKYRIAKKFFKAKRYDIALKVLKGN